MRLVGQEGVNWEDRTQFFGLAASAIRRLLVDHARARDRLKRGGDFGRVQLSGVEPGEQGASALDVLGLDEALNRLAALDERQVRIVELKFFGGLTSQQISTLLGVSVRTVDADWAMARAWLRDVLGEPRCS